MLDRLHAFAESIVRNNSFSCVYQKREPASPEKIRKLEKALRRTGVPALQSLLTFYRDCDGLTFRWSHKEVTHPDYLAGGDVEFDSVDGSDQPNLPTRSRSPGPRQRNESDLAPVGARSPVVVL